MKLHDILMRHAGPKSSVEFTLLKVIADSEEQILARLDAVDGSARYTHGAWAEREDWDEDRHPDEERGPDDKRLLKIYDDKYNVVGTETYMQRMLRLRGEFNDENANFDDAYYGIRHYGWTEGVEISNGEYEVLRRFVVVEDWREAAKES